MNVQLVRNNEVTFTYNISGLPFSANVSVPLPEGGQDRWRAELHTVAGDVIVAMTNHVFLVAGGA